MLSERRPWPLPCLTAVTHGFTFLIRGVVAKEKLAQVWWFISRWPLVCHCLVLSTPAAKLSPWSRVLTQLVKKLPVLYGTRRFITVFTTARHRFLSWARWIQSTLQNSIYLRSILILFSHLRLILPCGLFLSVFPTKILYALLISRYMTRPSRPPWFDFPNNIRWTVIVK
jgi:hypothetical protein